MMVLVGGQSEYDGIVLCLGLLTRGNSRHANVTDVSPAQISTRAANASMRDRPAPLGPRRRESLPSAKAGRSERRRKVARFGDDPRSLACSNVVRYYAL